MKGKIIFVAGAATGFVLGSRAGRGAYERIKSKTASWWGSDTVQEQVTSTKAYVADKAPVLKKKAQDASSELAKAAKEKKAASDSSDAADTSETE